MENDGLFLLFVFGDGDNKLGTGTYATKEELLKSVETLLVLAGEDSHNIRTVLSNLKIHKYKEDESRNKKREALRELLAS